MVNGHGATDISLYMAHAQDRGIAQCDMLDVSAGQCLQVEWAAKHLVQSLLFSCQKEAVYAIYDALYARREVEHGHTEGQNT